MNRFKKELIKRGIVYSSDNPSGYDPYEEEEELYMVTNGIIITFWSCNVVEPHFKLYDRNFNFIAEQSTEKDEDFFGEKATNPWSVRVETELHQEPLDEHPDDFDPFTNYDRFREI